MPLMNGFLRRKDPASSSDIRRHSFYPADSSASMAVPASDNRASEQIPRRSSAAEFLSPDTTLDEASAAAAPAESVVESLHRTVSPPIQEESQKHRRFSMLRFRNASDSQLATRARLQARAEADAHPMPQPPAIITTAPTIDVSRKLTKKKSKVKNTSQAKAVSNQGQDQKTDSHPAIKNERKDRRNTMSETRPCGSKSRVTFDEPERPVTQAGNSPPAYGDEGNSTLALPLTRLSESSRSDGSCGENGVYATTTTTTHTVQTTTTFFRIPRRKKPAPLFDLLRQNSEPPSHHGSGLATPGSSTSKNNSVQLARESPIVLPERYEDDTPAKYLVRLEEAVSRGVVASVLSKGTDPFSQAVLRSYMRGFGFFGDPMDMAIRKLLMEVELPKETQQIDRCLQGFANRYHECNPGIYASPDQAYFIAFSLLILHTDVFNKNNKHKMQKPDYLKNTRGEGIFDEILECFYDNISYTPFIHVEDDLDINGERIVQHKMKKKSIFPRGAVDPTKRPSKDPVDPYTLIIDSKLGSLRPNLKDVMCLEEPYSYLGTAPSLNLQDLQKTFFRTGVLQIVSARSRPDAFMNDKTVNNPEEARAGIVDIKITKVGLLWRKDAKKKKTRSPWQEWGAILTGAQLYFFRNTTWIKNLMHQLEMHIKQGHDESPVVFRPPLDSFKPDALMSTDDAVALLDSTYKKHKNAFVFVRHGGFEETFLADNEQEMNDWLAKLNYAAAFRTSGVRMRGVVGGNYDGQRTRGIRRPDSQNESMKTVQIPAGEVTIVSGKIDTKMAQDILAARREIMLQKIADAEEKLTVAQKQLDAQLRNARHLQILAPIQPKTREQVILAAGRMAAQLKWGRMEIWRLKCHRDILTMDLEEEEKNLGVALPKHDFETLSTERTTLGRLSSKASAHAPQQNPRSPKTIPANRPSTPFHPASPRKAEAEADVFQNPPELAKSSSFHRQHASWELPPLSFEFRSPRKPSFSGVQLPSSPGKAPVPLQPSLKPMTSGEFQRDPSSNIDAAEQAVLEQSGLVQDMIPDGKRPATGSEGEEGKDQAGEKDKLDRGKIRRSLHRTLREAHVPSHRSSRKGKDSSSSAGISDEGKDEVLSRGAGSFVVHGKKASVITFGSELQSMSPDERLRLRKQPYKAEPGMASPATIDDDFHSVLAEPYEFHERHDSQATTSSATARSFRDLHRKLADNTLGAPAILGSDAEDSDFAVSFSEGRRTPLAPVEDDENLYAISSRPTSRAEHATPYTPEASNSPAFHPILEKHMSALSLGDASEPESQVGTERLPMLQTVASLRST
ncbi:hypothetical protein PZA11_007391 [Diplocarpon coronariae]